MYGIVLRKLGSELLNESIESTVEPHKKFLPEKQRIQLKNSDQ